MEEAKRGTLTGTHLKWIAMGSMLIDHTAMALLPDTGALYLMMRLTGRLAFPLYCFLIVEGFYHTSNVFRYAGRLAVFALISEVPFDLAVFGRVWAPEYQNVFFTLTLGLLAILYYDKLTKEGRPGWAVLVVVLDLIAAYFLSCDYGAEGVLLTFLFYLFRYKELYRNLSAVIWCICMGASEAAGAFSVLFLNFYNGERGRVRYPYFFYAFYPAHLLTLGLLERFLL